MGEGRWTPLRLFSDVCSDITDPYLRLACHLAEEGRSGVAPNPLVGCVIVRDGEIVGRGVHLRFGGPHAEAVALAEAGDRASGATAYVTLEPCNHHGKTPPCTQALIAAGISRVVIGMPDIDPEVTGGGADVLREAGVEVEFAEDPSPFEEQNTPWLHRLETGRPWVRLKTAVSLDARTALRDGKRARMSDPVTDTLTMRLRRMADAVLVGARTAEVDDPALTVRDPDGRLAVNQPIRVVLGRNAVPDAGLLTDGKGRAIALVPQEWASEAPVGVEVLGYDGSEGLLSAIETLGLIGVTHLLVEAAGGLLTAFWERDLIDELVLYHAGGMAGPDAPALFLHPQDPSGETLDTKMRAVETGIVGEDAVTVWRRKED